jgi:hypothetical protein
MRESVLPEGAPGQLDGLGPAGDDPHDQHEEEDPHEQVEAGKAEQ